MRVSDIIGLARRYLKLGFFGVVFLLAVFLIGYFVVYKKILKGQKKIRPARLLWWSVIMCYLFVVAGATLLSRGSHWMTGRIMPLFYSYKDAWVDYSATSWRNIILNICMFVPLGFLLPLGQKRFRKAWKTYLMGFLLTILIELAQLVLRRGVFEWDDLMDNTVGAMIGYGLYALYAAVLNVFRRDKAKKESGKTMSGVRVAALQVPLLAAVSVFSVIFTLYEKQELGNSPYQYIMKYNKDQLSVTGDRDWSNEEGTLPVYKLKVLSERSAAEFAEKVFRSLGTELLEERNNFYENTAFLYAVDHYSMRLDYRGGTYSLTDFDTIFPDDADTVQQVFGASGQEVKDALQRYDVQIPEEALFSEDEGTYKFRVDMLLQENYVLDGTLTCDLYSDGKIGELNNQIKQAGLYKEFPVISQWEAYQRICDGEFRFYGDGALHINVMDCRIIYAADTKGYYQPVYDFLCEVNGEETDIMIPAIH